MGQLKKAINKIDASSELGKAQKELLETLNQLAESKAKNFKYEIEESLKTSGTSSNARVPISSIIDDDLTVRVFVSSEITNVKSEATTALSSFAEGTPTGIINGVGSIIGTALGRFLGESVAETMTFEDYYVFTDENSVLRVDMKAWYQEIKIQALRDVAEKITAIVYFKSIVDLTKIDFPTLLYLYQDQLRKTGMEQEEIFKALEKAKKIYKEFREINKDIALGDPTKISIPPSKYS